MSKFTTRSQLRRAPLYQTTHSFRRTALTRMSDAGIPLRHIQEISGHRTLAALERYLGVTEKQKQNAILAVLLLKLLIFQ
ncbi:tyrosine-type recombinase/integrase [Nostoc sp. FACHB-110]|nr:tyrosine-type recombinase/integrase [Nostoc sp. FACHB-110]